MFDKNEIIEILQDNDLDNVKEIQKHRECFVIKFSYEFDQLELDGAKDFANEECDEKQGGEVWYDEFLLPYLNDMAIDNINDIIDEIADEFSLDYEMLSFELSQEEYEEMTFLLAFYRKTLPISIDDLILEL